MATRSLYCLKCGEPYEITAEDRKVSICATKIFLALELDGTRCDLCDAPLIRGDIVVAITSWRQGAAYPFGWWSEFGKPCPREAVMAARTLSKP
jgi:hypothetical protein